MANSLLGLPYVKSVYFNNNYVTITKEYNYEWSDIMLKIKEFVKEYVENGGDVVKEGFAEFAAQREAEKSAGQFSGEDGEIAKKIKDLIDMYVKPAVEGDGGNIEFKSFQDGIVTLIMQGACSGCPSSTVTLKSGIEAMLKRMVPQVKEVAVVAVAGHPFAFVIAGGERPTAEAILERLEGMMQTPWATSSHPSIVIDRPHHAIARMEVGLEIGDF